MKHFVYILLAFLYSQSVFAQGQLYVVNEEAVEVSVSGGSTLTDWVVRTTDVEGYPDILTIDMGNVQIKDFDFKVIVKSMDGSRGASMNNKIYKALLSDAHPHIVYDQSKPTTDFTSNDDGSFILHSIGSISIAGVEKDSEVEVKGHIEDKNLILEASHALKMSAYNIDPPSAMFGQIQTKDNIVVNFKFVYNLK